jgi:hypothetical protein
MRRTSLGLENAADGVGIPGIGGQAINRLGRQRNQLAGPEQFNRARHRRFKQRCVVC